MGIRWLVLLLALSGACSKADVGEPCDTDSDCNGDLWCDENFSICTDAVIVG